MNGERQYSRKQFLKGGVTVVLGAMLSRLSGQVYAESANQTGNSDGGDRDAERDRRDKARGCFCEPDLSSYTEITELALQRYGRREEDGKFDLGSVNFPSIGDVFYTPVGTDIVLTFKSENIVPYMRSGDEFKSLKNNGVFKRHHSDEYTWYYGRTKNVCVYLGAYRDGPGGKASELSIEDLWNADPHLYIRFPGRVTNTVMASRIRIKEAKNKYQRLFTIVHATDTHGDMDSTHAIYEYADQIEADFVALTGDYVPYGPYHGCNMLHSVIRKAITPTVYSIGNHDVVGLTDKEAYAQNILPIRDVLQASAEHPYYYRDFSYDDETVRAISLYPFNEEAGKRNRGYYTEEQLQWLCETLASTPEKGHILILRHFAHHKPVLIDDEKNMFYDLPNSSAEEGVDLWLNMGSDPVTDIVDAFNNRSSIFAQYTGALKDRIETVTVKYDFSDRPNSEFVAYLTGHIHVDAVGYARNTRTRQAVLCSLCSIGWKGTENYHAYTQKSTFRDYGTDSQIAFNVFTFNFEKKKIFVARVGNGMFRDQLKTSMELSYA